MANSVSRAWISPSEGSIWSMMALDHEQSAGREARLGLLPLVQVEVMAAALCSDPMTVFCVFELVRTEGIQLSSATWRYVVELVARLPTPLNG